MSLNKSIAQQKRAEKMRKYISTQLKHNPSFVLDEFPKWAIYHKYNYKQEADDGSWNYNAIENAIAYSEIKKYAELK